MTHIEKLTETEVIERIAGGEKSLFEFIIKKYNATLYKIGRSYNYNHEDTQDLMQDTFIDAYKSLLQFEGRSSFKTWIIRIMMNNCYRKSRKSSYKNEITQDVNEQSKPIFSGSPNGTEETIRSRELGNILEEALGKIPSDYRMVFSLREVNGLNVAETADLMNISEANVKVRLNRSKAMLRNEIEKSYAPKELFEFNLVYCNAMVENVMKKINEL